MSIKNPVRLALKSLGAAAGLALSFCVLTGGRALAMMPVTVRVSSSPATVSGNMIHVIASTYVITDPRSLWTANSGLVQTLGAYSTTANITHDFILNPTAAGSYYIFAFNDSLGDFPQRPDGTEPMGGIGLFPYNPSGEDAQPLVLTGGETIAPVHQIVLRDRVKVTGTVISTVSAAGGDLVIAAVPFPYTGIAVSTACAKKVFDGSYHYESFTLDGLLPGTSYTVMAFVDINDNRVPEYALYESTSAWSSVVGGAAGTTQDAGTLTIVAGAGGSGGGGAPAYLRLEDDLGSNSQTLLAGAKSMPLKLTVEDANGNPTALTSALTVAFTGTTWSDGATIASPALYDSTGDTLLGTSPQVVIDTGSSSSSRFRFAPPAGTAGFVELRGTADGFPDLGWGTARFVMFGFDVLAGGGGFANASVRTNSESAGTSHTSVSITPNWDGANDAAVFTCTPPGAQSYELLVATSSGFEDGSVVRRLGGSGSQEFWWNGEDQRKDMRPVANGTYYARFQLSGGGVTSSVLNVTVQSAYIRGTVTVSAVPTEGVAVNVWGPGGGYAVSGADGAYFVGGLTEGSVYTVNFGGANVANKQVQNVQASAVVNVDLSAGAVLCVHGTVDRAPTHDAWGGVNVHDDSWQNSAWGGLRIRSGQFGSDNGYWYENDEFKDVNYSTWSCMGLPPSGTYTVETNLWEYGHDSRSVTLGGGGTTTYVSVSFTRQANVNGTVTLPSAPNTAYGGEWVSVDATKNGEEWPSAWGGAWISSGQTSATYNMPGLSPGTYRLRATCRGYSSRTVNDVAVGTSDVTVNFSTFDVGGRITGTVKVIGNTNGVSRDQTFCQGDGCAGAGKFNLYLNAWSPRSFNGSFTEVSLDKNGTETSAAYALTGLDDGTYDVFSWLNGFEMEPPGPKRATVSGGAGSLDLTFRKLSGEIKIHAQVASGDDPGQVSYRMASEFMSGADAQGNLGGDGRATIGGLGTGLYRIEVQNNNSGRGLRKDMAVAVTNGAASEVEVDLSERTQKLSGTLKFSGNIDLPAPWSVTVSSAAGLSAAYVSQSTDTKIPPIVQVYAFPLPSDFHGKNIRPTRMARAAPSTSGTGATFEVTGLPSGSYLVRVQEDLNPPAFNDFGFNMGVKPEFASTSKVIYIEETDYSGLELEVSNGVELKGTISRPTGDTDTFARSFRLQLRRADNLVVYTSTTSFPGAGTASYSFTHLSEGDYVLELREETMLSGMGGFTTGEGGGALAKLTPKYAAEPKRITVGKSQVTQNITLVKAGAIVGRLRDADSNTLITKNNVNSFLPDNYLIQAEAYPWVPGGWAEAERDFGGNTMGPPPPKISTTTNQFTIYRLLPGGYNVSCRTMDDMSGQMMSKGQKAYAAVVKSGVQVAEGQTVDVGTIDLNQGVSISGTVTDTSSTTLPNVRVVGTPSSLSGKDGAEQLAIRAFTDRFGKYELQGADRLEGYYDVTASPRFEFDDLYSKMAGKKWAAETAQMVDVNDAVARADVNFQLTEANASISGRVATEDGGALEEPFSEGSFAERRAHLFLHNEEAPPSDNPLGEIEAATDGMGRFRVDSLKPGTYVLYAVSVGYASAKTVVVAGVGDNGVGTITLKRGATLTGTVKKPNGSYPSTSEMAFMIAADEDMQEFVFGHLMANTSTRQISSYKLTGFKPGLSYAVISGNDDDIMELTSGISFTVSTETRKLDLLYRPAPPVMYATQTRAGSRITLRFFSTQKLRNLTAADNDLTKIIALTSGAGSFVKRSINNARDTLTAVYELPPNEAKFKIRIAFTSVITDPDDPLNTNFAFSEETEFFAAAARMRRIRIGNIMGGRAMLEGDPTGASFSGGIFQGRSGYTMNRSTRVVVGVVSAADLGTFMAAPDVHANAAARAQSVMGAARALGPAAYPSSSLYGAVQMAAAVNPFSAFYDILLPAGVNSNLKKEALLSLRYDTSVADTSKLNIYYYDETNNIFLLENSKRKVDTKNKTITVAVKHMSTFVVLNSNAAVIGSNTYTGKDILFHNFPNPFNLQAKSVTLNNANPVTTQNTDGTMIKVALPAGKSGAVKVEIYTVAGELVRTLALDCPVEARYYYLEWDGKNDGGKKVASGVYLGRFTVNGGDERFHKMAVLK